MSSTAVDARSGHHTGGRPLSLGALVGRAGPARCKALRATQAPPR
jgi:hypothetical protein